VKKRRDRQTDRRKAVLLEKRFNVDPLSNIKSYFVTIDSKILYGIMRKISPEFNVSREEFTGENRETYWKNIFNFKRLKVSKQKVFTGVIETDGVSIYMCTLSALEDRSSSSVPGCTRHEG